MPPISNVPSRAVRPCPRWFISNFKFVSSRLGVHLFPTEKSLQKHQYDLLAAWYFGFLSCLYFLVFQHCESLRPLSTKNHRAQVTSTCEPRRSIIQGFLYWDIINPITKGSIIPYAHSSITWVNQIGLNKHSVTCVTAAAICFAKCRNCQFFNRPLAWQGDVEG